MDLFMRHNKKYYNTTYKQITDQAPTLDEYQRWHRGDIIFTHIYLLHALQKLSLAHANASTCSSESYFVHTLKLFRANAKVIAFI